MAVPATDGPVRVRTRYTGLSAGTELSFLTGTNPALNSSFDQDLGLFRTDRPGAGYPVERLGYMEVAEVVDLDAAVPDLGFAVGDTVAMTYGHRTGYRAELHRLAGALVPRGTLAVQMPRQYDAPSHRLIREIAGGLFPDRFAEDDEGWVAPVAPPYLLL